MLQGVSDRFNGVTLRAPAGMEVGEFTACLRQSLARWREEGKRGLWVTVASADAALIPALIAEGFQMHHVDEADRALTLTHWLEASPSQLPRHSTHQVGVGGLVFHPDKRRILCITERFEERTRWKLPGGLIDPCELMEAGVAREVREETGVQAVARGVLLFRERTDGEPIVIATLLFFTLCSIVWRVGPVCGVCDGRGDRRDCDGRQGD